MTNRQEHERMICEGWKLRYKQFQNNSLVNVRKFADLNVLASASSIKADKIYNREVMKKVAEGALGFAILGGLATFIVPGMWILGAISAGVSIVSGVMSNEKVYDKWVTLKANTVWKWFRPKKYCDYQKEKLHHDTFISLMHMNETLDSMYPETESLAELDHYMDFRNRTINQAVNGIRKNIEKLEDFSKTSKGRKFAELREFVEDYKTVLNDYASYEQQGLEEYNNEKKYYNKVIDEIEHPERELNEFLESAWNLRHTVKTNDIDVDRGR